MTREEAINIFGDVNVSDIFEHEAMMKGLIHALYNDFESRTCDNCKYGSTAFQTQSDRNKKQIQCLKHDTWFILPFGCNKWEKRDD